MRIFRAEIYKLLSSKPYITAVVFALVMCFYLCISRGIGVCDSEYRALYDSVSADNAVSEITKLRRNINYGIGATYDDYLKYRFLSDELKQAGNIAGYDEYLTSIDESADKMTGISLFADKDSFAYKNIVSIPPKYDDVRGVKPVYSPSEGVLLSVANITNDITLLFLSFAAVFFLIGREKEEGVIALIKSTRYGRGRLGAIKCAALLLICFVTGLVIYSGSFMIGAVRFGAGDLSRPIQSLEGFIGCNLKISVLGGMVLILLLKISAVYLCSLLFSFLLIRFKSVCAYAITAAVAAAEIAAYSLIDIHSVFSPLARINLAAFVRSDELFRTYRNFNFFGEPVDLLTVSATVCGVLVAGAFALNVAAFSKISVSDSGKKFPLPSLKFLPKNTAGYAAYKLLITHHGLVVAVAAVCFELMFLSGTMRYFDRSEAYYRNYCGIMSEMTLDESERYASDTELIISYASDEENAGFYRAKAQLNMVLSVSSDNKAMFCQTGWEMMFGVNGFVDDMRLALVSIGAVCFAAAPLIAYDKRRNMTALIYASRSGKRRYIADNIAAAALFSFILTLLLNAVFFVYNINIYGSAGLLSSIRNIAGYESFADMPILGYIAFLAVVRAVSAALTACVILFISGRCKSVVSALIISLVLFLLPIMVYLAGGEQALMFCVPYSINNYIFA